MKKLSSVTFILSMFLTTLAFAQGGGVGHTADASPPSDKVIRGGGSLCEIAIDKARNKLLTWLKKGGGRNLDLSSAHMSYETYQQKMIASLTDQSIEISCKDHHKSSKAKPKPHPIFIDGVQKTCENSLSHLTNIYHIQCDYDEFYSDKPSPLDQLMLIHHEFASLEGQGIETNVGARSDTKISEQILKSIVTVTEYDLSPDGDRKIKAHAPTGINEFTRPVISLIFEAWGLDFSDLSKITKLYDADEMVQRQHIQKVLTAPGKEVQEILVTESKNEVYSFWTDEESKTISRLQKNSKNS